MESPPLVSDPLPEKKINRRDFLKIGGALAIYGVVQPIADVVESFSPPEKSEEINSNVFFEDLLEKEKNSDFFISEAGAGESNEYKKRMVETEVQKFTEWYKNTDFSELFKSPYFVEGALFNLWIKIENPRYAERLKRSKLEVPERTNNNIADFYRAFTFLSELMLYWANDCFKKGKSLNYVLKNLRGSFEHYKDMTTPSFLKNLSLN